VRRADNLTTFMCDCLEVWETQPPGTLKAYNGIALPVLIVIGTFFVTLQ
jgi:hypothetical protein